MTMRTRTTMIVGGLAAILALLMAGRMIRTRQAPDHAHHDRSGFRIIAHRGGMGLGPENTMEAFNRSLAAGADTLDMDIRMTRDGELIVMHDDTVDRTTDGSGAVRDMELRAIKTLDAGTRRSREGRKAGLRDRRIVVPTVGEVLDAFPDTALVMEIKDDRTTASDILCGLLADHHKTDSVLDNMRRSSQ